MTYRASIAERIAWTSALRPVDKVVLQALATFANFQTGQHAYPGMRRLRTRVELSERTIFRALHSLETDGWILARRRHRHATTYDINVDRLATNWTGAKVITTDPRSDCQVGSQPAESLTATFVDLTAKSGEFDCQVGSPIPSTDPDPDLSAPPLRVGSLTPGQHDDAGDEGRGGESATQSTAPASDVCADGCAHPDDAAGGATGHGRDQAQTSSAGLPLRQRADSPSGASDHGSRAPVGPHQQTLGPFDVTPQQRQASFAKLADVMRAALQRKSG